MSGNRVEDLEAKVRELEATINGLTDELVETKERLEAIEEQTGIEPDSLDERFGQARSEEETPERDETETEGIDEEPVAEGADGEDEDGEETADSAGDDIIVA
jgi:uncharacterized coiled-coil protein SlyX